MWPCLHEIDLDLGLDLDLDLDQDSPTVWVAFLICINVQNLICFTQRGKTYAQYRAHYRLSLFTGGDSARGTTS